MSNKVKNFPNNISPDVKKLAISFKGRFLYNKSIQRGLQKSTEMERDFFMRAAENNNPATRRSRFLMAWSSYYEIYLMLIPVLAYFLIFCYGPMFGLQIAFKNFKVSQGIWGSAWVGFKYFERFFKSPMFGMVVGNTFSLSLYALVAGFAPPIVLAILFNYQRNIRFKKLVQSLSFAPHFISMVVMVGMLKLFTSQYYGVFNHLLEALGGQRFNFMASQKAFPHLYVWSGIWQNVGWSAIIYISALSTVDPGLHEAAIVDGATILQRIWHIDLPSIANTILILLILNCGNILSVGFEKVYLMQNDVNTAVSEVISTYVYKQGIQGGQFSYSAAIGMFNGVINLVLLLTVNTVSRKVRNVSIF